MNINTVYYLTIAVHLIISVSLFFTSLILKDKILIFTSMFFAYGVYYYSKQLVILRGIEN